MNGFPVVSCRSRGAAASGFSSGRASGCSPAASRARTFAHCRRLSIWSCIGHEAIVAVARANGVAFEYKPVTLSLSGVYTGPVQLFPLGDLFDMQVQLRMGQANVRRWVDDLLPLLGDDDPLGTADLVTHRTPLEQAPELYRTFQRKEDGCVKVVLKP